MQVWDIDHFELNVGLLNVELCSLFLLVVSGGFEHFFLYFGLRENVLRVQGVLLQVHRSFCDHFSVFGVEHARVHVSNPVGQVRRKNLGLDVHDIPGVVIETIFCQLKQQDVQVLTVLLLFKQVQKSLSIQILDERNINHFATLLDGKSLDDLEQLIRCRGHIMEHSLAIRVDI